MPGSPTPARSYPPSVTLLRRSRGDPSAAPARTTFEEIEAWLLSDAMGEDDLLSFFESLVWRLVAAGFPLDRASLHIGTLHPQLVGFAWNWTRATGTCDEVKVSEAALKTDAYKRNPLFRVIEFGESYRGRTGDPETAGRSPLMAELAAQGLTEYVALPLRAGGAYHNAATAATKQAEGFTEEQLARLRRILRLLALHVERHIAARIAGNVLDAYLGPAAGQRVLRGSIKRGAGESIRAIIWASDLRGFTDLADRLDGPAMIAVLNAYFERLVGAIMAHGGEVLKYIGDGLLAVFPYGAFEEEAAAAAASLAAAEDAMAALRRLNEAPPEDLAAVDGWRPLESGIALHDGEVFFGNVGSPDRLDFTVIGRAVNAAARVEALSKALGRSILVTGTVARALERPLDHLGEHALRGLAEPVSLFSPPQRLAPERPLPSYAYVPGKSPHPTRDEGGHSRGAAPEAVQPPDAANWPACSDYLYGIDLFNRAFYWEAHEAWEGLWAACGRRGTTAAFLQALIALAAAGHKARTRNPEGVRAHAAKALRHLEAVAGTHSGSRFMGLDLGELRDQASRLETVRASLDLLLRPCKPGGER